MYKDGMLVVISIVNGVSLSAELIKKDYFIEYPNGDVEIYKNFNEAVTRYSNKITK